MAGLTRGGLFEVDQLDIAVVDRGFILGVSTLGTTIGAESTHRLDVADQLTSLEISHPRKVDSDLFITTDTATLTMRALFEDAPDLLRDKTIIVSYAGMHELFRGSVIAASRSVDLDTTTPGYRKWSVSLTATTAQERSVRYRIEAPDAPEDDVASALLTRLPYISAVDVADDVAAVVAAARIAAGHEDAMTGAELITRCERITSTLITPDPALPSRLRITSYDDGPTWTLRDDHGPSFRGLSFSESKAAATSVTVAPMFKPSPAEGDPELDDLTYTRTLPGAIRNDQSVSLDVPFDADQLEAAAQRMPIKRGQPEYVTGVALPFDPRLDYSAPPTRLELWLDGRRRDAAIIGVKHSITAHPPRWSVALDCAPIFLLTRESDAGVSSA